MGGFGFRIEGQRQIYRGSSIVLKLAKTTMESGCGQLTTTIILKKNPFLGIYRSDPIQSHTILCKEVDRSVGVWW